MTAFSPAPHRRRWPLVVAVLLTVVLLAGLVTSWRQWQATRPPAGDDLAATEANSRGVGRMEQFDYAQAADDFREASRLAPEWLQPRINLGMALYSAAVNVDDPKLDEAVAAFDAVLKDDPDNPYAHFNLGIIAKYRARYDAAQRHFRMVLELDPKDDRAWLYLGQSYPDAQVNPESKADFQRALDLNPYLVPAWYALANHVTTSEAEQRERLEVMKRLQAANWEDEARPDKHSEQGRYATAIGRSLAPTPAAGPSPAFEPTPSWHTVTGLIGPGLRAVVRLDFDGDGKPDVLVMGATAAGDMLLRNAGDRFTPVALPAGPPSIGCAVGDFDNDGRPDLALATSAGLRLLRSVDGKGFVDVSAAAGFDRQTGVFATLQWLDIDQDGDLDLIVGGEVGIVVFQNAGVAAPSRADEPTPPLTVSFKPLDVHALKVPGPVTGLVATDIDGDKDVDLVALRGENPPAVILNDRLMRFHAGGPLPLPTGLWFTGLVLDANGDAQSDPFVLGDGKPALLVSTRDLPGNDFSTRFKLGATDSPRLLAAQRCDLNLDGYADTLGVAADGRAVFLQGTGDGRLIDRSEVLPTGNGLVSVATADFDSDGTPDLLTVQGTSLTVRRGIPNGNHGLTLAFTGVRDNNNAGSGQKNLRTNTGGIGVLCRTMSGPLRSAVELTTLDAGPGQSFLPVVIGLGRRTQADALRLRWPDCVVQAEVGTPAGHLVTIRETNRKPTSCPVLMTWDGERWVYVTDFLGGGALGESGVDGSARPPRPEESVAILPHQLGLKDGRYVMRIAEPMDEALYLDHVRLAVIDRPTGEPVVPDERFAVAAPWPTQQLRAYPKPIAAANVTDHAGRDQTTAVARRDGVTAGPFRLCSWLGFAEDHWLEFDFAGNTPAGRLDLVIAGWTDYPYPESIFAAGQAGVEMHPPTLERRAADGTWVKVADLGFPAGLRKVMTVPVTGLDLSGRLRVRTNLQVHVDQLFVAIPEVLAAVPELPPARVTLSHPGFVREISTSGRSPQAYDPARFEAVATTSWTGKLTRLGDVTPLLAAADDRLAVLGPGDELLVEFDPAGLPPLEPGFSRSFVLRTHGYCKDTAPTTQTGGHIEPLPYRAMPSYPHREPGPPAQVADRTDWQTRPAGGTP
jgi:hypothetical protein